MEEGLFTRLRAGSAGLWDTAQQHGFVSGLADGSLSRECFACFLQQDYLFLIAYSRALALAAARCPSLELLTQFSALLHSTLSSEMQLHRDYCAQFGLSSADLAASIAAPACQAYGDFCISTAASGGPLDLLAALIPCGVGYWEIGQRLGGTVSADPQRWPDGLGSHPYGQWIATYASAEFGGYAQWMIDTLDALGAHSSPAEEARLQGLFNLGCRYEWLFWELAWNRQSWPL